MLRRIYTSMYLLVLFLSVALAEWSNQVRNNSLATQRMLDLYSDSAYLGSLRDYIHQVCPAWLPCVAKEPTLVDGVTCCLTCRCDELCHFTHSCCPGVIENRSINGRNSMTGPKPRVRREIGTDPVCIKPVVFAYGDKKQKLESTRIREYEFIDSCPHHSDTSSTQRCSAGPTYGVDDGTIYKFADIMPVTVINQKTNFVNRHCAVCHGVDTTDMEFWESEVSCDDPIEFADLDTFEKAVQQREDCYVKFHPPPNVNVNESICISDAISGCNVTGQWHQYDSQIDEYCSEIDWLYTTPRGPPHFNNSATRYNNIFCAMCNGEIVVIPNTVMCPYASMGQFHTYSFVGLMSYASFTDPELLTSQTANGDHMCAPGKQSKPIQGHCEPVICTHPMILDAVTMTCKDLFREINLGLFRVSFEVKLEEPIKLAHGDARNLQADLMNELEQNIEHGLCGRFVFFFKSSQTPFDTAKSGIHNINIDSLVLFGYKSVESFDGFRFNPRQEYTTFINVIENYNMSVVRGISKIANHRSDTFFLPSQDDGDLVYVPFYFTQNIYLPFTKDELVLFEDLYDGSAIFGNNRSFVFLSYNPCKKYDFIIDETFLDCPAFVYDMADYGIKRSKHGLTFTKQNVIVDFQKFRSLNHTHCIICIDAMDYITTSTNHTNTKSNTAFCDKKALWKMVVHGILVVIFRGYLY